MDGIHDMGGMHGFGAVEVEADEPVFHERWEGRTYALNLLAGVALGGTVDEFRHALELLDPVTYLSAGYYGRWLAGLENRLAQAGLVDREELAAACRHLAAGGSPAELPFEVAPISLEPPSDQPGTVFRDVDAAPTYRIGDEVATRNMHPAGHTRLPRYARGKKGVVTAVYPACVFPDTVAHHHGENPQYLYNVSFDGGELWGDDAEPGTHVHLDLFESYLEPKDG